MAPQDDVVDGLRLKPAITLLEIKGKISIKFPAMSNQSPPGHNPKMNKNGIKAAL